MRRLLAVVGVSSVACCGGVFLLLLIGSAFSSSCFAQTVDSEFAPAESGGAEGRGSAVAMAQPGQAAPARRGGGDSSNRFGVGVNVSTLGVGGDLAVRLTHRINARAGGNFINFSHSFTDNGISYGGQLHFRSAEAYLDWFFLGPLHLSGGALLYNGNNITATAAVPTGSTFSLNGTTYESSAAAPLGGSASLKLNKAAPAILLGVGNMIPRSGRHFGAHFEIGGMYEGSPNVVLGLTGTACAQGFTSGGTCQDVTTSSAIQANVTAQQNKFNHDARPYKFYPIVSTGFSIAF